MPHMIKKADRGAYMERETTWRRNCQPGRKPAPVLGKPKPKPVK